jgi:hypothetical protein
MALCCDERTSMEALTARRFVDDSRASVSCESTADRAEDVRLSDDTVGDTKIRTKSEEEKRDWERRYE